MRIASLVPSATEIVCALGLESCLVGVSHECDYPPSVRGLPHLTASFFPGDATSAEIDAAVRAQAASGSDAALYRLDEELLRALQPDLIVSQSLCDVCAVSPDQIAAACRRLPGDVPVVTLGPTRLAELWDSIHAVAAAAGADAAASRLIAALSARLNAVARRTARIPAADRPRVAYFEWIDPPFTPGHWIPEIVALAGGECLLGRPGERSRVAGWNEIVAARPDALFVACCGYDARRNRRDLALLAALPGYDELPAVRGGRVYVADGNEYFSRPGPRLVDSAEIMAHALHPGLHPAPSAGRAAVAS